MFTKGHIAWNKGQGKYVVGKKNPMFGKKHSMDTKLKISAAMRGRKLSKKHIENLCKVMQGKSHPFYGKRHTRQTLKKMRLSAIKRIEEKFGQPRPNYNPTACLRIDEYGKQHGYNFQHAENGGEFFINGLGYWVDGYDKKRNVVIEYYERAHRRTKKRDARRKKEIVAYLGCKFIELRETT